MLLMLPGMVMYREPRPITGIPLIVITDLRRTTGISSAGLTYLRSSGSNT